MIKGTVIWGEPRALSQLQQNRRIATARSATRTLGEQAAAPDLPLQHRKHNSSTVIE